MIHMKTLQYLFLTLGVWFTGMLSGIQAQQSSAPYSFEWEVVAVDSIP